MTSVSDITLEAMAGYRAAAEQRKRTRSEAIARRRARALEVAAHASGMLKREYGAHKVVVFGSAPSEKRFHMHSDLDLAVWGLAEDDYLKALAALLSLDAAIPVDLVSVEQAPPRLQGEIEEHGVIL